jgi:localization factor PodJL
MLDERGRLALRRLGEIYAKGLGVERNWEQAKIFYSEAATARDVPSMVALAEYYSAEKATHTDLLAAYSWYNKLAAVTPGSFAFATASDNGETYRMLADATRKRDALEKKLSTDELRRAQGL